MDTRAMKYISKKDAELLQTEFFLNYVAVASRKVEEEHCIIRLILSTFATPEEIANLTRRDLRAGKFYSVRLFSKGRSRISPIDEKTFKMVKKLSEGIPSRASIFRFSKKEIDEIVKKNSPPGKEYDAESLRNDAIKVISDNLFFESEFDLTSKTPEKIYLMFLDANPLYSGVWDVEDDLLLEEFLRDYELFLGAKALEEIAEEIGESVERLKRASES